MKYVKKNKRKQARKKRTAQYFQKRHWKLVKSENLQQLVADFINQYQWQNVLGLPNKGLGLDQMAFIAFERHAIGKCENPKIAQGHDQYCWKRMDTNKNARWKDINQQSADKSDGDEQCERRMNWNDKQCDNENVRRRNVKKAKVVEYKDLGKKVAQEN